VHILNILINWRSIKEVGMPKDTNIGYLVYDGESIEYSGLEYGIWTGGSVYALYEEVSGTEFDFYPTHWCPTNELNTPK